MAMEPPDVWGMHIYQRWFAVDEVQGFETPCDQQEFQETWDYYSFIGELKKYVYCLPDSTSRSSDIEKYMVC